MSFHECIKIVEKEADYLISVLSVAVRECGCESVNLFNRLCGINGSVCAWDQLACECMRRFRSFRREQQYLPTACYMHADATLSGSISVMYPVSNATRKRKTSGGTNPLRRWLDGIGVVCSSTVSGQQLWVLSELHAELRLLCSLSLSDRSTAHKRPPAGVLYTSGFMQNDDVG